MLLVRQVVMVYMERLASNSLLESLVFAKRAARKICGLEQTVKPVDFSESAAV